MQTSLARRRRRRRSGAARRSGGGGGTARALVLAIPVLVLCSLLALGVVGFLGAVTTYAVYSRGLPDPKSLLTNLVLEEQTIVLDRTGEIELARLGELRRELARFEELPPELLDATTAIEDQDFWKNPGFDPAGFLAATLDTLNGRPRGGSTITQQLVRARLLPPEAFEGSVYERKIREIIQSVRLTEQFPGEDGKRQIITAYLNQNFYGNNSYGVKAAARGYFGAELADLTLAQAAMLAAIPQSPTKFDLVANAEERCTVEVAAGAECPADARRLVVPADSEVVRRRNYVLERMADAAVLSRGDHTAADYARAKAEPVVLADQRSAPWRAPHFVWQVRDELASILCPNEPVERCREVDLGGLRVETTLDLRMQVTTENWVYAASRIPNGRNPAAILEGRGMPAADREWILALRGRNIHNGAAAAIDYRTGQVLAYVGSGGYTAAGNERFQPQFDVLAKGWRQPGSAIKPLNYLVGIDDRSMTAATLFMDVVTDFGREFTPKQADDLERGPVRLRPALQFSLNVPSVKAGLMNGLDRLLARWSEMGLSYPSGALAVPSMGIGTLEVHPIDLLGAYGAVANGGILMPRTTILKVTDRDGRTIWSADTAGSAGRRIASAEASYIVTDILAGNTRAAVNPYWAKWAILDGEVRRPAAYKTGTTSDNRDVAAYGYLAPLEDPLAPALAVGVWMGNSNNEPNDGKLSLDTAAPLWSRILRDLSAGMPIAEFERSRPPGVVVAEIDAHTGQLPGPFTVATVPELFIEGTVPTRRDDSRVAVEIDAASGLRWQPGCAGPPVTVGVLDLRDVEAAWPAWRPFTDDWLARAAKGPGTVGGPEKTAVSYFYNGAFQPWGPTWGGAFASAGTCTPAPAPPPAAACDPARGPCSSLPPAQPGEPAAPGATAPPPQPAPGEPAPTAAPVPTPAPEPTPPGRGKPPKPPKP